MKRIAQVAEELGLTNDEWVPYGHHKAKVPLSVLDKARHSDRPGRLVLVTAITPTPAGEGKTTTSIGLGQALYGLGERVCLALREPSLGPCFGIKGGGTGGGECKVVPHVDINLHFNGDFHAITAANNLLSAVIDNHLHFGTDTGIDARRVLWRRVLDVNDRALRYVTTGQGQGNHGVPAETGFDITAASEIMAILCLSESEADLRRRLDNILVGLRPGKGPLRAEELTISGALVALLKDALLPNLVQTTEGTPALVHGGPFANIAHGCNSVLATRMALHLADWVVTEAGFGGDLGAEKFFDIKCATTGLNPSAVVVVATMRALKMHGGVPLKRLSEPNPEAVRRGLANLDKHVENMRAFGKPTIVALNGFPTDTPEEIEVVRARCAELGVPFAPCDHFARGGKGAESLAHAVLEYAQSEPSPLVTMYTPDQSLKEKVEAVAKRVYGADGVNWTKEAEADLKRLTRLGYAELPVCMSKTQNSLSDDPKRLGRPSDFHITVRQLQVAAGAGFVVVLTGELLRMPGLPRVPQSEHVDVVDGEIVGIG